MCIECLEHLIDSKFNDAEKPTAIIQCPGGLPACDQTLDLLFLINYLMGTSDAAVQEKWKSRQRTYQRVLHEESVMSKVARRGVDLFGVPIASAIKCMVPDCGWFTYHERNAQHGIPTLIRCVGCDTLQCTGCSSVIPRDAPAFDSVRSAHQDNCRVDAIHQPYEPVVDFGPLGTSALPAHPDFISKVKFDAIEAKYVDNVIGCLNYVISSILRGRKCPSCNLRVSKDEHCTKLTCTGAISYVDRNGKSVRVNGCGVSFCYCCGGHLVTRGDTYVRMLSNPVNCNKLALYSRGKIQLTFRDDPPAGETPIDNNFVRFMDIGLKYDLHMNGWEEVFHPDFLSTAGRCPAYLQCLINRYPWFLTSEPILRSEAEKWAMERWTQLRLLKQLYRWFVTQRIPVHLARRFINHPTCVASRMAFVVKWIETDAVPIPFDDNNVSFRLSRGILKPLALMRYDFLFSSSSSSSASSDDIYCYSQLAASRDIRVFDYVLKSRWQAEHLRLQRWIVAGVIPRDAHRRAVGTEEQEITWIRSLPCSPMPTIVIE